MKRESAEPLLEWREPRAGVRRRVLDRAVGSAQDLRTALLGPLGVAAGLGVVGVVALATWFAPAWPRFIGRGKPLTMPELLVLVGYLVLLGWCSVSLLFHRGRVQIYEKDLRLGLWLDRHRVPGDDIVEFMVHRTVFGDAMTIRYRRQHAGKRVVEHRVMLLFGDGVVPEIAERHMEAIAPGKSSSLASEDYDPRP